jgi:hypothetical protein
MRAGWSQADPEGGWRMYRLDGVERLEVLPGAFDEPRPGFNPQDAHFAEVFCRVAGPHG